MTEPSAARRGLANVKTTPLALDALVTEKAKHLFERNGIYSHPELEARHEIELEKYIKKVQIESRIMGELATSHVLPSAIRYQNLLAANIKGLKDADAPKESYSNQKQILEKISEHINKTSDLVEKMIEARKICNNMTETRTKAIAYQSQVKDTYFDEIRYNVDKLEAFHLVAIQSAPERQPCVGKRGSRGRKDPPKTRRTHNAENRRSAPKGQGGLLCVNLSEPKQCIGDPFASSPWRGSLSPSTEAW